MAKEKAATATKSAKSVTKTLFFDEIAKSTELTKAQVAKVFEAMEASIVKHLGKKGTGVLTLPGLFKLKAKRVPAVKGGKQVPNRFKPGEFTVTKDKPASTKVKAFALKRLKDALK